MHSRRSAHPGLRAPRVALALVVLAAIPAALAAGCGAAGEQDGPVVAASAAGGNAGAGRDPHASRAEPTRDSSASRTGVKRDSSAAATRAEGDSGAPAAGAKAGAKAGAATADPGALVFRTHCVRCHGPMGRGDGPDGAKLEPKPTNFNDAAYMRSRTDSVLLRAIRRGKGEGAMPAWGQVLSEAEIQAVLAHVKKYAKKR